MARSIDYVLFENIKLYPNPVNGNELYITDIINGSFRVYNSFGQEISNDKIENSIIPISDISSENYLVEIISN